MTASAVNVLPRPTESARMQPSKVSSLLMIAMAASLWKSYSLPQMALSRKPVPSLGSTSSDTSSRNSLKMR